MNFKVRWSVAVLMLAVGSASAQEPTETGAAVEANPPGAAASIPSALGSVGSFFKKLLPGSKGPGDSAAPQGEPAAATAGPASAFNIVDIDSWSRSANVILDPQCKTMVQPFGMTDSAASLGLLAVKANVQNLASRMGVSGQPQLKTVDVLKQAARGLNWLPTEVELRLGEALVPDADVLDENKNTDSRRVYQQARALLAEVVGELPQPLPYQFRVLVRTTSQGGASSLPGGIIMVDRELFRKDAQADYAYFVLSHEVAHVLQRHQTRAYQAQLVDGVTSLTDLSKFLSEAKQPDPRTIVSYASALKKMLVKFSADQELQADSCAIRLMSKRRPDAKVMEQALRAIEARLGPDTDEAADGPGNNQLIEHLKYLGNGILERHPNSAQRRANLYTAFNAVREAPPARK